MMKFRKRAAALLAAAAMLFCQAGLMPAAGVQAADDTQDDWLHVEGDKIVDMNGNEVWLTGVNWFGYNVGSQVFDGVWCANMHDCLKAIADHGFNLLRVPMSTQIILQWKNKEPDPLIKVGEWENPELTVEGVPGGKAKYSFDVWNQAVEWCKECGIKIMMDIHCATTNAAGHNLPLWYDENYTTKDWLTALEWFCDYYKNDDTIVAIDLKNEPHGKPEEGKFAKWDESTDENNWKYAAERGAAACLGVNPNLLIMVEGIECYPDFAGGADWSTPSVDYAKYGEFNGVFGAWWGANLRGVKELPLDGDLKSHVVYSPHDYGPLVHPQKWFHLEGEKPNFTSYEFDRDSIMKEYWKDTWAYICEDHIAPLLMGEWGGFTDDKNDPSGANRQWLTILRDYMIEKHIHHTFWCFNENSSDTGGLVGVDFKTWDEQKYEFVKPSLWKDENGVFISLDHKYPVGVNGQSLSEYYGGGVKHTTTPTVTTTTATTTSVTVTTTTSSMTTVDGGSETTTHVNPAALYGDVNNDKTVDVKDAVMLARFVGGDSTAILSAPGEINSELNGDGKITTQDMIVLLRFLAKLIDTLPYKQ